MAEPPLDIDPEFEPLSRPRSCTWPLRRPDLSVKDGDPSRRGAEGVAAGNEVVDAGDGLDGADGTEGAGPSNASLPCAPGGVKKGSSRRNAWGNLSYADLITSAIESAPEHRLTLAQIYEWMVRSVPYFRDKGDSNSSAGWKNSIRHNLSLHSKFIRVQNEGTGKSSWWVLNPDGGKGGKSPRRRAVSMETNSSKLARSRARAVAKKKAALGGAAAGGASALPPGEQGAHSPSGWGGSPAALSPDEFEAWSDFRSRAGSATSAGSLGGRLSPIPASQELEELREEGPVGTTPVGAVGVDGGAGFLPPLDAMSLQERLQRSFDDELREELMDELLESLSVELLPPTHGVGAVSSAGGGGGSLQLLMDGHLAMQAPAHEHMVVPQDMMMQQHQHHQQQHQQQHQQAMATPPGGALARPQSLASPQQGYAGPLSAGPARFLAARTVPPTTPLVQNTMPASHGCVYATPPSHGPAQPPNAVLSFGAMQRSASYTFGMQSAGFFPAEPTWGGGGGGGGGGGSSGGSLQQQHHVLFTQSPPANAGATDSRRLQALSMARLCMGPGFGPACARQEPLSCKQVALPPYHNLHQHSSHHHDHQQQQQQMTALTRGPVFTKPPFQPPGTDGVAGDFANPTHTIRYRPAFPSAPTAFAGPPGGPLTRAPHRDRFPRGPTTQGPSTGPPPAAERPCSGAQHRLPSDLDPEIFGGGLECDLDSMIRHELTESGSLLDVDLDTYVQAVASVGRGVTGGAHSWVPG